MDPSPDQNEEQVQCTFPPFLRIYSSGRVQRFSGTSVVPPSADPADPVLSKDVVIDPNVSARLYIPNPAIPPAPTKLPVLVYYHGGGFCTESAFSPTYHTFLNSFVSKARVLAVSVNYRLAPEHKLPAAYEDSWAALQWVASTMSRAGGGGDDWIEKYGELGKVFVAGDSAGANIAHHVAVRSSASPSGEETAVRIQGMLLIHPYFGSEGEGRPADRDGIWKMLSEMDADDPRHNPMAKGGMGLRGLAGCGRVMVCVAEGDFLKGRGVEYFEKLKAHGGGGWGGDRLELVETEGEGHVFHLLKPGCEKGVELVDRMIAFINKEG